MRPMRTLREIRPVNLAAGTIMLAIPTSAAALAATQADAQTPLQIDTSAHQITLGKQVRVDGRAPATDAGQRVELEYERAGNSSWRPLSSTTVAADGSFKLHAAIATSGQLRALATGGSSAQASTASAGQVSQTERITVVPKFKISARAHDLLEGQATAVEGRLLPAVAGRKVRLIGRSGGRWHVLTSARTGARGGFKVRYRPPATGAGGKTLRVQFPGDGLNARRTASAGRVTVFHASVASWYSDGGNTACGFHAGYGVANRVLPCGTKVTFRYGGRTVTATVDDRGPFVGGREWDLNQNTAAALGFGGVGTVWATS